MKRVLHSVCHGNWKGYEGTKEEISAMIDKCLNECSESETTDLEYKRSQIDEMKPNENGLYEVVYWSKW